MFTILLLLLVLTGFVLMTRGHFTQEVAIPLVVLAALALAGAPDNQAALQGGFAEFSRILLIFTAVAVPAHLLMRGHVLHWIGLLLGEWTGLAIRSFSLPVWLAVPTMSLAVTWAMAAGLHNTTSILVGAQIIAVMCRSYHLPVRPALCGALIASNLGGFSSPWGDTPNIIETAVFHLNQRDFLQILPVNLGLLLLITGATAWWTRKEMKHDSAAHTLETAIATQGFRSARANLVVDGRLLMTGVAGILGSVVVPMVLPGHELALCAIVILACVLLDYPTHRRESLTALGVETYVTLGAIFVLGHIMSRTSIGVGLYLQHWLERSGMPVWAIAVSSYIGTLLTEAASWASAAAPIVQAGAAGRTSAWALGAGICAGSSSLLTAATAGILLSRESRHFAPTERITFGSYLTFGLTASLAMLTYYIFVLTLLGYAQG